MGTRGSKAVGEAVITSSEARDRNSMVWHNSHATGYNSRSSKKSVAFKEDVRVIRTSVDRPEISLIIQPIEKNEAKTFEGLYFVLDKVINSSETGDLHALSDIPKTIIYFESKAVINKALACIRRWLVQLGYDIQA